MASISNFVVYAHARVVAHVLRNVFLICVGHFGWKRHVASATLHEKLLVEYDPPKVDRHENSRAPLRHALRGMFRCVVWLRTPTACLASGLAGPTATRYANCAKYFLQSLTHIGTSGYEVTQDFWEAGWDVPLAEVRTALLLTLPRHGHPRHGPAASSLGYGRNSSLPIFHQTTG